MSDDFLEELKRDFLNEALFMMEQYEESMLALESSQEPQEHIGRIFRVAHSIKGGAAAVGFEDLSKFAHKAEDLLSILRIYPEKINTEIITLFLAVGDQFKLRLTQLQTDRNAEWSVPELENQLLHWIKHFQATETSAGSSVDCPPAEKQETPAAATGSTEDVTNYELLAELEAQIKASEMAANPAPNMDNLFAVPDAEAAVAEVLATTPELVQPAAVSQTAVEGTVESPVQKPTLTAVPKAQPATETTKKAVAAENTILKVDSMRVDAVLDVVGEIVVLKNQLLHSDVVSHGENQRLTFIVDQLDKSIRDLYEKTLGIRMTPLRSLFTKLQRTVRDVSVKLQKPVDLELVGEETEVDRSVFELLGDPLMHMARNAMDHGIETREQRIAAGKPEMAKLTIAAKQVGASVVIEISEDGRGIYRDKVLAKAMEKNLIPSHVKPEDLTDDQVFQFLFAPGFSTAEKVTDLSGRGVGLDVVKSNIEKAKGQVRIKSTPGKGSTFEIRIPLTTSITDGIVVAISGQRYMIPIHSIREIVQFRDSEVTQVANVGRVLKIRNKLTPVIDFQQTLDKVSFMKDLELKKSERSQEQKTYIVLELNAGLSALPVDDVLGQSQVVAKPLQVGHPVPEFSGAATLGDGRTILILEPNALAQAKVGAA
jgi:two-component system, chemotaxis family, sensor kinase CheA